MVRCCAWMILLIWILIAHTSTGETSVPKKPCSWSVVEKSRNVHELKLLKSLSSGGEAWLLWQSDEHWDHPKCDLKKLKEHHQEAAERGAAIVKVGDTFCVMQGKGDPRGDKSGVRPEHWGGNYLDLVVNSASDWYGPYKDYIKLVGVGNHECHDDATEILTERGWVYFKDLEWWDKVATMNLQSGVCEYQRPECLHKYWHEGRMVHLKSRGSDICVTGNHRMVYQAQKRNDWWLRELDECPEATFKIPVALKSGNPEFPGVADDELRLCGWILTDGSIMTKVGKQGQKHQSIAIWQRKSKVQLITQLLDRMGYHYKVRERQRDVKEVCGRILVKPPEVECRVSLSDRSQRLRILSLVPSRGRLPSWVANLSDRQFAVFLEALIDGDGSRHKSSPETSWMFYGQRALLDDVQAGCVTHGYRTSLYTYRDSQCRLNITPSTTYEFVNRAIKTTENPNYEGYVWCVTVPNGTTITRRNGKVAVTGNSRVYERHETCLIERLCQSLRDKGGQTRKGGYSGWVRLRIGWNHTKHGSFVAYYHHGFGGGGPASKGTPDFPKIAEWIDADAIICGHIHYKNYGAIQRARLNDHGVVVQKDLHFVRCSTYKDEFEDGYAGFHIENGRGPRTLGGWWQRVFVKNDQIQSQFIEAN